MKLLYSSEAASWVVRGLAATATHHDEQWEATGRGCQGELRTLLYLIQVGPQSSCSESRGEQTAQIPPTAQTPSSRASYPGPLPERPELSLYVMLFRRGHGAAHQKDGSETASAGLRPAYD